MQSLRVGFLSDKNCFDKNVWSGTLYYMQQAFKSINIQIVHLGNGSHFGAWQKFLNPFRKKNPFFPIGSPAYIDRYTKFSSLVKKQLAKTPCDVIFAPIASSELAFIETNIPIIYLSDTTFRLYYQDYYLNLGKKLDIEEIEGQNRQELTAISKATKLVYPSSWAARSAIDDYGVSSDKITVIPFGANLDSKSVNSNNLKSKVAICRLLFVGKDWDRKGGNIAFETLTSLLEMGVDAELIVVGCIPPSEIKHDKITIVPFLNKNIPIQKQKLEKIFSQSDFFIFPARAECYGIVLCEANAFGIPVFATEVGGIPSIIKNGKNGYLLPLSASGKDYAKLIKESFSDRTNYEKLTRSSRKEYETRLNWKAWAEKMYEAIVDLLK
jgi:glycosyltransferase involved in cell wall biosynthesis